MLHCQRSGFRAQRETWLSGNNPRFHQFRRKIVLFPFSLFSPWNLAAHINLRKGGRVIRLHRLFLSWLSVSDDMIPCLMCTSGGKSRDIKGAVFLVSQAQNSFDQISEMDMVARLVAQVWWIGFLLFLTTSASPSLQHSRNLGSAFPRSPVEELCYSVFAFHDINVPLSLLM